MAGRSSRRSQGGVKSSAAGSNSPGSGGDAARGESGRKDQAAPATDQVSTETQDVEELEDRLREKEHLVAVLTERLEQAAEQLDRIRRTGGDRGVRTAGLPPELVEEQKSLVEDLHRAVQQWEDLQAAAALGRIEVQISELRDLISGQLIERAFGPGPPDQQDQRADQPEAAPQGAKQGVKKPRSSDRSLSGYEALKANLLADSPEGSDDDEGAPQPSARSPAAADKPPEPQDEPPPADPPEPLDVAAADIDQLRDAVEKRDSYITWLIHRFRAAELRRQIPGDWSELQDVPDEMRRHLEELEGRLQEMLRLAEVELSLERARLGR
jgi:hypothetical protein